MQANWHTASPEAIERELATSFHSGLSGEEAKKRFAIYGPNELPAGKVASIPAIFFCQFKSPLIYILLAASVVVFLIGEITDSLIILFVLAFNAVVGTIQEGKAQNTLLALKRFAETQATVLRDGKEMIVQDAAVVPGDVVILHEGERIAADARVVESKTLRVDEAALTGESVSEHKTEATLRSALTPLAERINMVFKGTHVVSGSGRAVAVATGVNSEIGKISKKIAAIDDTEIPLKRDIHYLSRLIVMVVFTISTTLFLLGIISGKSAREMFATVVSLSVSIIPEGLPVVLTLVLATGVWRMAKRNALVKKLQAVEALGQARVIAVDKTGTLTRNEMVIREVFIGGKTFTVGGTGYEPEGEIKLDGNVIDPANHPELLLAGKIASFCASARAIFSEETGVWRLTGDPTEAAMFVFAEKTGFHKDDLERESPLIGELPFDYKTKYHVTAHRLGSRQFVTAAGAPESVFVVADKLQMSDGAVAPFTKRKREEAEAAFHGMSKRGLRIVAFAYAEMPLPEDERILEFIEVKNLVFAGFYGMEDSLRPEVPEAMERAGVAGIRVVMITGDHRLTALAIAKEAGVWKEGDRALTGEDIEALSDEALMRELAAVTVFARVTPEHKMRIIQGYRRRGEIVSMTGDGVNDAPSLVAADLGVAMGRIGTEVAKEAADIVLLDDNFGSIVSAVEEGRSIYKTIKKVILYLFSTSLGEVLTIVGALVAGFPLPILAAQILWLNLVTDGFLSVALAMEPKEAGLIERRFERPKKYLVDKLMAMRIFVMAIPMMVGSLYLFRNAYEADIVKAWTLCLTTLAIFQWFNAWNCRSEDKSVFQMNPFSNKFLVGATVTVVLLQIAAVHAPFMQNILRTMPLTIYEWISAAAVAFLIVVVEEVRKFFYRRKVVAS